MTTEKMILRRCRGREGCCNDDRENEITVWDDSVTSRCEIARHIAIIDTTGEICGIIKRLFAFSIPKR